MSEIVDAEIVGQGNTQLGRVMQREADPEATLALLEKKASLSARHAQAINTLLVTQTFPQDWNEQGGKMCLGSAGAERIGRMFPIQFEDATYNREEIEDKHGKGFRYVCECKAALGDRVVFAQGSYSTRDKFLGYANSQWKDPADINEGHIRNAAYHICIGNAIKLLLGIRNMPRDQFDKIMAGAGHDPNKAPKVDRAQGAQGGTSEDDASKQAELMDICRYIANGGYVVEFANGQHSMTLLSEGDDRDAAAIAEANCIAISSFHSKKDNKDVRGKVAGQLKAQWLNGSLNTARKLKTQLDGQVDNG